jgi:hypothetical protein
VSGADSIPVYSPAFGNAMARFHAGSYLVGDEQVTGSTLVWEVQWTK